MALNIQPDGITSDHTVHSALPATDARHLWEVSWLPGRRVSRNNAITAMVIADLASPGHIDTGHWLWLHIERWAAELALTGPEALTKIANPPNWEDVDWGGAPEDPEEAE
jgi:hypothetical protein